MIAEHDNCSGRKFACIATRLTNRVGYVRLVRCVASTCQPQACDSVPAGVGGRLETTYTAFICRFVPSAVAAPWASTRSEDVRRKACYEAIIKRELTCLGGYYRKQFTRATNRVCIRNAKEKENLGRVLCPVTCNLVYLLPYRLYVGRAVGHLPDLSAATWLHY